MAPEPVPVRVGAAFALCMRIRMCTAALTLPLLPPAEVGAGSVTLVLCVGLLGWIAARRWDVIIPPLLRHPVLVALDVALSFAVLGLGGTTGPFFLSTVITAATAGLLFRWPGMLAVSALQVLCYYAALGFDLQHEDSAVATFQTVLGQPAYYPLVGFAGVALRRLLDDQAALEAGRRRAEVAVAAIEERARLAREMHDSLAKTLRGIALAAAALPTWIGRDPGRAAAEAGRIAGAAETASREARALLAELRTDTAVLPLPDAVRAAVRRWEQAGAGPGPGRPVAAVRSGLPVHAELPAHVRHEALAILAEALTNVERHARARTVTVTLSEEAGGALLLTVADDGSGFRPGPLTDLAGEGHYGLVGLHERARRAGGSATVTSAPGAGTTVAVRLPALAAGGDEAGRWLAEVS